MFQHSLITAFTPIINRCQVNTMHSMAKTVYERVLEKPKFPAQWPFTEDDFTRTDENDDTIFYDSPRL